MRERRYKPTRAECLKYLKHRWPSSINLSKMPIAQLRAVYYRVADVVMGGL